MILEFLSKKHRLSSLYKDINNIFQLNKEIDIDSIQKNYTKLQYKYLNGYY